MSHWLPPEVCERFASRYGSPMSGDYDLVLDGHRLPEILDAMRTHGYRCVHDEALINAALGYRPPAGWQTLDLNGTRA